MHTHSNKVAVVEDSEQAERIKDSQVSRVFFGELEDTGEGADVDTSLGPVQCGTLVRL